MIREQHIILRLLRGEKVNDLEGANSVVLIELIRRHRLFPLTEHLLKLLDDPHRSDLKQRIQNWAIKSLHLSSVLSEIFREFEGEEIEALALKGPVLTKALYGDVIKRSFNDLDILVDRPALHKSIEVLKGLGFNILYPKEQLTEQQWDHYFQYKKEIGLAHKVQKSFIELHIGIYTHELLQREEEEILLDDIVEEVIYEAPVRTLNRENTFLYIVYHGAYHLFNRLFWLRDVGTALNTWNLDHQRILEKACRLGIDRLLALGVILSGEYCGTAIPEAYKQYLSENRRILRRMLALCKKRIMGPEEENFPAKIRRNYYFLLLKPGMHYRWVVFKSLFHRWYIKRFLGGH